MTVKGLRGRGREVCICPPQSIFDPPWKSYNNSNYYYYQVREIKVIDFEASFFFAFPPVPFPWQLPPFQTLVENTLMVLFHDHKLTTFNHKTFS